MVVGADIRHAFFLCVIYCFPPEFTSGGRRVLAEPAHSALHTHFCLICSAIWGYVLPLVCVYLYLEETNGMMVFQELFLRAKPTQNVICLDSKKQGHRGDEQHVSFQRLFPPSEALHTV